MNPPHRALGCHADRHDSRDFVFDRSRMRARRRTYPQHYRKVPRWRSQDWASGCVGCGTVGGHELVRVLDGEPDVELSWVHAYTSARLRHPLETKLIDDGTFIRFGMRANCKTGVGPEKLWPFDPSERGKKPEEQKLNQRPPESVERAGVKVIGRTYQRIPGVREGLIEGILDALEDGPVVIGLQVTDAFMRYGDGVLQAPARGEARRGGHCFYLAGSEDDGQTLIGFNSWRDWGFDLINTFPEGPRRIQSVIRLSSNWVLDPGFGDAWTFGRAA